uniref:GIY-YIG nuclease family protein n=1 Tax=Streptomyces sp. Wb2n-11 TaxID=1030533 RepID=UPI000B03A5C0
FRRRVEPLVPPASGLLRRQRRPGQIGTSTNITARLSALCLRKSNAPLLLNGGNDLEGALHQHFASDRLGQTEWFILSKRIQNYIAGRKAAAAALKQPSLVDEESTTRPAGDRINVPSYPRNPTACETILSVLNKYADPAGIDIVYIDRPALLTATSLNESTFANALSKLAGASKIHRIAEGKSVRVGLGHQPASGSND